MDAESQSEEELQSLTASHTPSYDATRTHFTNVQIDLIPPGHDDCRSERSPPSLGTSESNNRSGYLSTGNVNGSSIGMQEPASPQGNGSSQAFQPPPSIPQFSYYRYEHRPKASPPSSGDETYNSFSTTCSGSKRAARERSPVALLVGEKVTKECRRRKKVPKSEVFSGNTINNPPIFVGGCFANISRISWGARIRTSTYGFRVRCPTVRRFPSAPTL